MSTEDGGLAAWIDALTGSMVRIELETRVRFADNGLVSIPAAKIMVRDSSTNRWKQVGPLLLPVEGGTRADLLNTLADLVMQGDR